MVARVIGSTKYVCIFWIRLIKEQEPLPINEDVIWPNYALSVLWFSLLTIIEVTHYRDWMCRRKVIRHKDLSTTNIIT